MQLCSGRRSRSGTELEDLQLSEAESSMGQTLGFKQHSFLPASAPGEGSALPQVLCCAHPCGVGRPHMRENHHQSGPVVCRASIIPVAVFCGSVHTPGRALRVLCPGVAVGTKTSEEKVHVPPGCPWSASELLPSGGALLPLLRNMEAMAAPSVLGQEDPGVADSSSLTLHFSRRVPRAEHPSAHSPTLTGKELPCTLLREDGRLGCGNAVPNSGLILGWGEYKPFRSPGL